MKYCASILMTLILISLPNIAWACSVCFYGDADTPTSRGLRGGVLTLLAFLAVIMAAFVYFLARFKKRASLMTGES